MITQFAEKRKDFGKTESVSSGLMPTKSTKFYEVFSTTKLYSKLSKVLACATKIRNLMLLQTSKIGFKHQFKI